MDRRSPAHDIRLYHRLQNTARSLQRFADRAVAGTGLTTAQLAVAVIVQARGEMTQRDLAEELGLGENAVTAMLQRLETLDMVERRRDPRDARVRQIRLTEHGATVVSEAAGAFAAVNRAIDQALGGDGVQSLAAELDRLRAAVDDR